MPLRSSSPLVGRTFLLGDEMRRFFAYGDIEELVLSHRREVMSQGYEAIVALMRGGVYAAAMLSQCTGLPLRTARFDRTSSTATCDLGAAPRPGESKVLLVEDVAGKGWTLW